MSELRALRSLVKPSEQVTQQMIDAYKAQIAEAAKLKGELDLIHDAINKTKQEIATVHVTGFEGPEMARVTNELDAIVGGTETATETILSERRGHRPDGVDAARAPEGRSEPGAGAGHPGARGQDLRGLQLPGPDRPAHHQGGRRP